MAIFETEKNSSSNLLYSKIAYLILCASNKLLVRLLLYILAGQLFWLTHGKSAFGLYPDHVQQSLRREATEYLSLPIKN